MNKKGYNYTSREITRAVLCGYYACPLADIPAGTGLGSSGGFTTALLKALYAHRRQLLDTTSLAEAACNIKINRLGEPIGKQDQDTAAFGGVTCFDFNKDDRVVRTPAP